MQAILPNAGVALWVAGRVDDIRDGILLAQRAIVSGRAEEVLEDYIAYTRSCAGV
jgi:anthranilate phosphoribosyltransferase